MARIIAFINQSGGVGKTTLDLNTGYHLAKDGQRTLAIDMDSQASLTRQLKLIPKELEKTVADAIVNGEPLPIHKTVYGMDLVPSNTNLVGTESLLTQVKGRQFRLKQALEPIRDNYDLILIDCPPNLGLLSVMSLIASTHLLIPIEGEKGLEGIEDLRDTISMVLKTGGNPRLRIAGAVPMKINERKIDDRDTLTRIKNTFPNYTVHPAIPDATAFKQAWRAQMPLAVFSPKHPAIRRLKQIATSLKEIS